LRMPKETFFNLPEEKRRLICEVALEEFAAHPFEKVSVNRIVRRAGIAKGSFYQYFEDKQDLFFYLLHRAGEAKMGYLVPVLEEADQYNFFDLLRQLFVAGLRFAMDHPVYTELGRRLVATKGTPVYDTYVRENRPAVTAFLEPLLQRAIRRGDVRADIDVRMFTHLIALLSEGIVEYHLEQVSPTYDEGMLATVDQFITFLRKGIGTQHRSVEATSTGKERSHERD